MTSKPKMTASSGKRRSPHAKNANTRIEAYLLSREILRRIQRTSALVQAHSGQGSMPDLH